MGGYKSELVERNNLEAREDALAMNLKKWCAMVKQEVISPSARDKAELSRPRSDGCTSAPMNKARAYAESLGIVNLPDIDSVLNAFKIFSWCLHSLSILMRKPRVDEIRSLLSHSDSGYFKLPEAKCVRMLRSMSSRAQIWQSKAKKALMPVPGEKKPYDLTILKELFFAAKQIPLTMPEESRLWSTIEDRGTRHCICGGENLVSFLFDLRIEFKNFFSLTCFCSGNEGPSDGSFMLGCDSCDRWFHGSCMKIDKETGDALSKWICPPCTKGVPQAVNVCEKHAVGTEEEKLPKQEIIDPPLMLPLLQHPHLDISPHAPNPTTLWPPFGLRSSKEAVEALGKLGESDNEDFMAPIEPIARAKPDSNSYPHNHAPQASSLASSGQKLQAQPIAKAKSDPNSYPQKYAPRTALAASSSHNLNSYPQHCPPGATSAASLTQNLQPIASLKSTPKHIPPKYASRAASVASSGQKLQPIASAKSYLTSLPQRYAPRAASVASLGQKIQPITSAKSNLTSLPQKLPAPAASIASSAVQSVSQAPYFQAATPAVSIAARGPSQIPYCQPVASMASMSATSVSHAPVSQPQAGTEAPQRTMLGSSLPTQRMPIKTNQPAIASSHSVFQQSSERINHSSMKHYTTSSTGNSMNQTMSNPLTTMGLNGANLSVAVANMDAYVLTAGNAPNLHHVSTTPAPGTAIQMNVPNAEPMRNENGQSYSAAPFPHAAPKPP